MVEGHAVNPAGYDGGGLERSCGAARDRWHRAVAADGIELMQAWFAGAPYARHRHDTYNIGTTASGVQLFGYRGAQRLSTPGAVFVLHPDEMHDGRAGDESGFGYRQLAVAPQRIAVAVRDIQGRPCPLPFHRDPVSANPILSGAIAAAFRSGGGGLEPLQGDGIVTALAEGLMRGDPAFAGDRRHRFDGDAVRRAREFLDAESARVVRSAELEAVTGLSRYDLARQFRALLGTSPYRYLTMRRLDRAREMIRRGEELAQSAVAAGFADQAHLTRQFKAGYGITPARFAALDRAV
jgi:AraC-like DNA-binding protein